MIFCKMIIFIGNWWTIEKCCYFIKKRVKILKFCIFGTWNTQMPKILWFQHITVYNMLLCTAIYCAKQRTEFTLVFNVHLFNFLLSTCCILIMLFFIALYLKYYHMLLFLTLFWGYVVYKLRMTFYLINVFKILT